ncbi:MAG: copper amine oxidase-like protein [Bacilli bacterium]|nr:copper amine oxidase-like protein [Bacilli bacterium]
MKKFILGLCCGLIIACSSVAFASGSIQALLFPASFEINGNNVALNNDYKVLNVDGHAYVPIRFIAENLGGTIDYDPELQKIFVKNRNLDFTDPDYKGISIGNLILTKVGNKTKVTGQLKMEGVGNSKNMIGANLSFYNVKNEKIGDIVINGNDFDSQSQIFVAEGAGDFRAYSSVILHIGAVNNLIISAAPSIVYENTKYNFTLNFPKSWEGKYEVVYKVRESSNIEGFDFMDKANKAYSGYLFGINVWNKADWTKSASTELEMGHTFILGEKGGKVFTLSTPGDVNYDPHDERLTAEYASMSDHINIIKTTFKFNN